MGGATSIVRNIAQISIWGIEESKGFFDKISEILQDYREGKLTKEKTSEAIVSVCVLKNSYRLFHVIDVYKNGKPTDRRLFRSDASLRTLLKEALREGQALLYRGIFAIPQEVWEEYKRNYTTANRFEIFRLDKLTQMASYILVDLDGVSFEDLKRVVSYLHRLDIYPDIWQSASGEGNYHLYIRLTGRVERWVRKVKDRETGEERKEEHILYYLPYTSDYRVGLVIEGVKEIFRRLKVRYDSVSATRAVWLEGFPNPEKGGRASKKIWDGKVHRLDTLTEKLRPLWERQIREKARKDYFSFLQKRQVPVVAGTCEVVSGEHSNPIDHLQANVATAFRMLDRGYAWTEIERELRAEWRGDEKAFERAFSGFRDWVEAHYKPLAEKRPRREAKPKERRKHKHYWEHVPTIRKVLLEDGIDCSLNHIHRKTGIAKGTLSYIFRIVSREQILTDPEEAQELLRTYQKGGDRLSEEQREAFQKRGRERWERYLEQFLKKAVQKRKKSLGDKEKKGLYVREEGFITLKAMGVQIGSISITPKESRVGDGYFKNQTQNPRTELKNSGKEQKQEPRNENSSFSHNNGLRWGVGGREEVDVSRKVEGIPKELVRKHLEGRDTKPKYKLPDTKEKILVRVALELVGRIEERWQLELGELPERNGYRRLVFGALRARDRGERRTYDLGGWGRFASALGEALEELGHKVIYPKPYEPWEELEVEEELMNEDFPTEEEPPREDDEDLKDLEEFLDF